MMEQRLAKMWWITVNERKFIKSTLLSGIRIDGRSPFDYRDVTINFGGKDGMSEVQLGQTRVLGVVTCRLVQPYQDRPNEGTLAIFTEFSPMADPSFEIGRPGEFAVELGRIVDRGLRESRAVDTESLCVVAGKWVWSIRIDLHVVDNGGNLVDAANIAALAALLTFRRPECTLAGEDGQKVILHPPEVREPLPLILHHLPIAVTIAFIGESTLVVDPSHFEEAVMGEKLTAILNKYGDVCAIQKAGGEGIMRSVIMQCLRIASEKAADITEKINEAVKLYNTSRALKKINQHPDSIDVKNMSKYTKKSKLELEGTIIKQSDGTNVGSHPSKKDGSSLGDNKSKAFIGGPLRWDPYTKGIDADELKASLSLRAVKTITEKMDELFPVKRQVTTRDITLGDAEPALSSPVVAAASNPNNKAKTLMDAVKQNHRSRRTKLNT